MSYSLTTGLNKRGRDNVSGGAILYIAEHANLASTTLNAAGDMISGITMSGSTKFYQFLVPRENIDFEQGATINVPQGQYAFLPKVMFTIPGLALSALNLFDTLVRETVVVIVKTNEGKYFMIGRENGLDLDTDGKFTLGKASGDLIGSTINLSGLEYTRIMEIDPENAATVMASIVSNTIA